MYCWLKYHCTLLFALLSIHANCQNDHLHGSFTVHLKVNEALNQQPMPYVSVHKLRDNKGTITDFSGKASLSNVFHGDSITCYYIGFERFTFAADSSETSKIIQLQRQAQLIDEATVLADDAILYTLVSNTRKTNSLKLDTAKTYFELETFCGKDQLEVFQGYYNGVYRGYDVTELEMKSGRFALAPIGKRIFASTETSRAMYMQKLMRSNEYFPMSPMELSRRKLYKNYELTLRSKYRDEQQQTVYVINFLPKSDSRSSFKGAVWIDSLTNNILKIKQSVENTSVYPFRPIWPMHNLTKVDLEITKSFEENDGEMRVKSIDFDYDLTYWSVEDSSLRISTRAVLYAYNYSEPFMLPYFTFSKTSNADYRRMQMLPYNDRFWECTDEFRVESQSTERAHFINEVATIKAYELFQSDSVVQTTNFFEHPYVTWKGNRIFVRVAPEDSSQYNARNTSIASRRYNLEVQLFMDINDLCNSIEVTTRTIFDPYLSFYKFRETTAGHVFINIYFDLMEIKRRKLEALLAECGQDVDCMHMVYEAVKADAEKMSEIYFKEVQRGTELESLKRWNAFVKKELKIDNVELFGLEEEAQ